jgi:hypothetical protein
LLGEHYGDTGEGSWCLRDAVGWPQYQGFDSVVDVNFVLDSKKWTLRTICLGELGTWEVDDATGVIKYVGLREFP